MKGVSAMKYEELLNKIEELSNLLNNCDDIASFVKLSNERNGLLKEVARYERKHGINSVLDIELELPPSKFDSNNTSYRNPLPKSGLKQSVSRLFKPVSQGANSDYSLCNHLRSQYPELSELEIENRCKKAGCDYAPPAPSSPNPINPL